MPLYCCSCGFSFFLDEGEREVTRTADKTTEKRRLMRCGDCNQMQYRDDDGERMIPVTGVAEVTQAGVANA